MPARLARGPLLRVVSVRVDDGCLAAEVVRVHLTIVARDTSAFEAVKEREEQERERLRELADAEA